jgi:hypothetical protein
MASKDTQDTHGYGDNIETSEKDILHVLRRPDGIVFAELMMTPSLAERINLRRRKRGLLTGDWVPQEVGQYGLWHLDTDAIVSDVLNLTKDEVERFNKAIPKTMGVQWRKTNDEVYNAPMGRN